jgi:hypothetical protein
LNLCQRRRAFLWLFSAVTGVQRPPGLPCAVSWCEMEMRGSGAMRRENANLFRLLFED